MKIIFLDIDGVLNSMNYYNKIKNISQAPLDPRAIECLSKIVHRSNASIVLTSSWRGGWEKDQSKCDIEGRLINEALAAYDISIHDKTVVMNISDPTIRCKEVWDWIRRCPEPIESFVILDDANFGWEEHGLSSYWIRTDFMENGLTQEQIEPALTILKEKNHKLILQNIKKKIRKIIN